MGHISFARLGPDEEPTGTAPDRPRRGGRLTSLLELPGRLARLQAAARGRAERLLDVRVVPGTTDPPAELHAWLALTFGSVAAVREQRIVKVTNLVTLEATLFAPLRVRRPLDEAASGQDLGAELRATEADPFCHPETGTPADSFGRVRSRRMITGANAALADGHHAVLVFDAHDPLAFDADLVADLFVAGRDWAERARAVDPDAVNYLLIWNCLWRAGGSIVHGHAQALLGAGPHYARLERFRRDAASYRSIHGRSLLDDLVDLHRDLELAVACDDDTWILASITPVKERELLVVGGIGMDERDPAFGAAVVRALVAYRDRLGVRSFNLALWRTPLGEDVAGWGLERPMVRIVDRGNPLSRASDIGAMELYGTPVVGADPWEIVRKLG